MTISVVVPTRNRANLWRSGWLSNGLASQTDPPDEILIALDHTEDDTLGAIKRTWFPCPVRILDVLAPRLGPNPASALPDNCLIAAATGDIILHLDDDLHIHKDLCLETRRLLTDLTRAVIWPQIIFANEDHTPSTSTTAKDTRARRAEPILPGGISHLPRGQLVHWGPAWATPRAELLAIGGHCRHMAAFRNSDTRLGNRLVANGVSSYLGRSPALTVEHLGQTWYRAHLGDRDAIRASRGPAYGATIANGGPAYWTSNTCRQSYREIARLDSKPGQGSILSRAATVDGKVRQLATPDLHPKADRGTSKAATKGA